MQFTWLDDGTCVDLQVSLRLSSKLPNSHTSILTHTQIHLSEHDTIVVTGDTELQEALVMMQGRPMIKFDVKSVGSAEAAPAAAPVPASVPAETLPVPEVIEVAQAAPVQADAKVEAEAIQEAFDSSASAVAGVSEAVEEVAVTEAAPATVEVDAVASAAVSVDQTGAVAIATNVKEESEAEVAVVSHTEVTETTTETHTVATDADTVLHTATEDVHVHVHTVTEVKDVHTHTVEQVIEVTEHHENHKETAEIAVQTESEDTDKLEVIVEAAGDEIPAPSPARTLSPVPAADSESDSTITSTANAAASATATPGTFLYELNFPTQSALGLTLLPYKLHYTASEVTHTVDICIVSQVSHLSSVVRLQSSLIRHQSWHFSTFQSHFSPLTHIHPTSPHTPIPTSPPSQDWPRRATSW